MSFFSGILLVPKNGDLVEFTPLYGKRFSSITAEGDKIYVTCSDGIFCIPIDEESIDSSTEFAFETISNLSFVSIAAGKNFQVAIRESGEIYSWGTNGDCGQLGQGVAQRKIFTPQSISYKVRAVQASCGENHVMVVDNEDRGYCWGENYSRQLNLYTKTKENMSVRNALIEEVVFNPRLIPWTLKMSVTKLACGKSFTLALTTEGTVYSWGAGESGQLGTGRCTKKDLPSAIRFTGNSQSSQTTVTVKISDIACGDGHALAVSREENIVYAWGLNHRGQCASHVLDRSQESHSRYFYAPHRIDQIQWFVDDSPTKIDNHFIRVFAKEHCTALIDDEGRLFTCGSTTAHRLLQTQHVQPNYPDPSIQDLPYVAPGKIEPVYGIYVPLLVDLPSVKNKRIREFAFGKTRSAMLIETKLTHVSAINQSINQSMST
jgi:alpha-tubulin suppressor-like RCC1 family protein